MPLSYVSDGLAPSPKLTTGSVILITEFPPTEKLPHVNCPDTITLLEKSAFPLTSNVPAIMVSPVVSLTVKIEVPTGYS